MRTLSTQQARALALAAQGLGRERPVRRPSGKATLLKTIRKLGLLQIDSVNVLMRAHYMPLFSRLGPYNRDLVDRLAYRDRALFEYWGHEASLIPIEAFPRFRALMGPGKAHPRFRAWAEEHRSVVDGILDEVRARGPIGISEIEAREGRNSPWWGWPAAKSALEYLFIVGEVTTHSRRNFERIYDLTERVIPADRLRAPLPDVEQVERDFLMHAAGALGVATVADMADYWRRSRVKPHVDALVAQGVLEPVRVEGWKQQGYVLAGTKIPRAPAAAAAIVSPFDPIVWYRARAERLFGFDYRIEIYVPAPKRIYGYYVLPFLLGDRFAARVDLKADRSKGSLLVQASHLEEGSKPAVVAAALARELHTLAGWLALDTISVARKGDLASALRRAV